MTADCFLNGIILSLSTRLEPSVKISTRRRFLLFESEMMGHSSTYAVERWLYIAASGIHRIKRKNARMLLFIQEVSVMRQSDSVSEELDTENVQCALDFENTMNNLETQLYYRHLPPKEVALRVMEAACKFYDADWCGLIQVDLDLGLWKPLWWHNECQEDKTTILTNEFESSEFLDRWVKAVRR